jgi:hypothetical protein
MEQRCDDGGLVSTLDPPAKMEQLPRHSIIFFVSLCWNPK